MFGGISGPALVSIAAGGGMAPLLWWGWQRRFRPGVPFYMAVVVAGMLWSFSYGIGLLIFDPSTRQLLEVPQWLGMCLVGPAVLGFALEYTGRRELARSRWMGGLFGLFLGAFLLAATNPLHGFMWNAYEVQPIFGAAAVDYATQPVAYAFAGLAFVTVGVGLLLLLEAVVSDPKLYRRQLGLVVVGLLVPGVLALAWVTEFHPWYPLDLTPVGFIVTVVLVGYSIYAEDLFDLAPATRRMADRVAIDDLGTAVLVVNHQDRVVAMNHRAVTIFGVSERAMLGEFFGMVTGLDIELTDGEFLLENPTGSSRTFRVTVTPIDTSATAPVGHIVTVRDITEEHRRRQRLEVLNRVLRHNLRNDATVIEGNARLIEDLVADTEHEETVGHHVQEIVDVSRELIDASKKARDIARALPEANPQRKRVDLVALLEDVVSRFPEATVSVEAPDALALLTDERLLDIVLENLLENAILHGSEPVRVSIEPEESTVSITVDDDGPGIPEHELVVLERAVEDDLEHGSGLGLWITAWGVSALGGRVDFDVENGTSVQLTVPLEGNGLTAAKASDSR